jgi:hypothetical protein
MSHFANLHDLKNKLRSTKELLAKDPRLGEAILLVIAEIEKANALGQAVENLQGVVENQQKRIEALENQLRSPKQ